MNTYNTYIYIKKKIIAFRSPQVRPGPGNQQVDANAAVVSLRLRVVLHRREWRSRWRVPKTPVVSENTFFVVLKYIYIYVKCETCVAMEMKSVCYTVTGKIGF